MRDFFRDERKALAALLGAAFLVRLIAALTALVIEPDGARFTLMARHFTDGRWDEGLDVWPRMSPLYPILIAGFGSGAAVSIVLGTLSVLPVYSLARSIWDRRVATLAAGVVAFAPDFIRLGGAVMSEAAFCFFFFSAMTLAWRAAEGARWRDWLAAGIAGGLATLTRPEGVYFVAAIAGWPVLRAITLGGWARRLAGIALAIVVFGLVVLPYARWIHGKTGRWAVSDSPFTQDLMYNLGLAKQPSMGPNPLEGLNVDPLASEEVRMARKYGEVPGKLLHYAEQFVRICGILLFPFLLIGFFRLRRRAGEWFAMLAGLGYALPPLLALLTGTPFGHRYVLPAVLLWSPIVALGLIAAGSWLGRFVPEGARFPLAAAFLVAVALTFAVKADRPTGENRRTLADAGRWIRMNSGPRTMVIANDRRISHYAESYTEIAPASFDRLVAMASEKNAQWIALVGKRLDRMQPGYREAVEGTYERVHTVPKTDRGDEVRIYRVAPR